MTRTSRARARPDTLTTLRAALEEMTRRLHDAPAQDCAAIAGKIAALGKALTEEEQRRRDAAQTDAHSPALRRQFEAEIERMIEARTQERLRAILSGPDRALPSAAATAEPDPDAETQTAAKPKPRRRKSTEAASAPGTNVSPAS